MDEELYSVAIHEAGHVVVAHTFRYLTDRIELFRNANNQWSGRSHIGFPRNLITAFSAPERHAKIAISGILAQAKMKADESRGSACTFDPECDFAEIAGFLSEPIRTSDDQRMYNFRFCKENSRFTQSLAGVHYSDGDKKDFLAWRNTVQEIEAVQNLIRDTMSIIDDPQYWSRIEELARNLVNEPPDGPDQLRTLHTDRINQLLPFPSPWESVDFGR